MFSAYSRESCCPRTEMSSRQILHVAARTILVFLCSDLETFQAYAWGSKLRVISRVNKHAVQQTVASVWHVYVDMATPHRTATSRWSRDVRKDQCLHLVNVCTNFKQINRRRRQTGSVNRVTTWRRNCLSRRLIAVVVVKLICRWITKHDRRYIMVAVQSLRRFAVGKIMVTWVSTWLQSTDKFQLVK